jgi:hypothetical protein
MLMITILFSFLILFTRLSFAQGVEISAYPTELRILAESNKTINITIANRLSESGNFLISVFPTSLTGINIIPEKNSVFLLPGETKTVKILLIASIDVLEKIPQSLQITTFLSDNPEIKSSTNVIVISERTVPVMISSLSVDKSSVNPGETITISVSVTNYASSPSDKYNLKTTLSKEDVLIKSYEESIESVPARSTVLYNYSYTFDKYAEPGKYVIFSEMKDLYNRVVSTAATLKVEVNEINPNLNPDVIKIEKSSSMGVLSASVTIKLKNEGNVPAVNFTFTESFPVFIKSFFEPETKPTISFIEGNKAVYKWQISTLMPGEETVIKYNIRLWNLWIGLLIIAGAVYFFFKFTFTPVVIKSHRHRGPIEKGKEILVTLDVRNHALKEIKKVVVRDFVPPIAKVVERFDTLRPTIKVTSKGTELIWKFDSLKPKEERVLTYRIKPTVDIVGRIYLPPSEIIFTDHKGQRKEVKSKSLIIKGKR